MKIRTLLRLYPRAWRERYGDEFLALLGDERISVRTIMNIVSSAMRERFTRGGVAVFLAAIFLPPAVAAALSGADAERWLAIQGGWCVALIVGAVGGVPWALIARSATSREARFAVWCVGPLIMIRLANHVPFRGPFLVGVVVTLLVSLYFTRPTSIPIRPS